MSCFWVGGLFYRLIFGNFVFKFDFSLYTPHPHSHPHSKDLYIFLAICRDVKDIQGDPRTNRVSEIRM